MLIFINWADWFQSGHNTREIRNQNRYYYFYAQSSMTGWAEIIYIYIYLPVLTTSEYNWMQCVSVCVCVCCSCVCIHSNVCIISLALSTEIRMTASILKQDPNRRRFKKALFNRTKHNMLIFRVTVFIKLQSDTITCVKNSSNSEKEWTMR